MSMVRCQRCGSAYNVAHVSADTVRCPNCGEQLPPPSDPNQPAEALLEEGEGADWPRIAAWSLAGLAVFFAALIAVVLAARQVRPWVHGAPAPADSVEELVRQMEEGEDDAARQAAARQLLKMGPDALALALDQATYVPPDRNMLQVSGPVIEALARLPKEVAAPAGELLASPRDDVRVAAASILRNVGGEALVARDALSKALTDENRWVRWAAADALGNLGAEAVPAVDALASAAQHPDRYTRRHAIDALGEIGPPARQAVAALKELQENDKERSVRQAAETALHQIDLDTLAAEAKARAGDEVRALIEKLGQQDEFASRTAAEELGKLGPEAEDALPALGQALRHPSKWVRIEAAKVLAGFGRDARPYAPALRRLTRDSDPEVSQAAEKACQAVGGP